MTRGFYRYPTLCGDRLLFVTEDDLWEVAREGGLARRVTGNIGAVSAPCISPDGEQVAFIAQNEGAPDLYVMPTSGGQPRRLTFDGTFMVVVRWSEDGKSIIFSSGRNQPHRNMSLFSVPAAGGAVRSMSLGEGTWTWSEPGGKGVVVGRHRWDLSRWKRYKGGLAGELWVDAEGSGSWKRIFADRTEGFAYPIWQGGRLWFLSDMEGHGNLYSCDPDGGDVRRETNHIGFFTRHLQTDGERFVYSLGGDIYCFDPATGQTQMIEIDCASPRAHLARKFVDATDFIDDFELHPRGHSVALTTRGKCYNFGLWEGAVRQTGVEQGVRYRMARYLPDGDKVLVLSDEGGEEHFELHAVDGSSVEKLEVSGHGLGRPVSIGLSPDGKFAAIGNHRHELLLLSMEDKSVTLIAKSNYDRIDAFSWAPDSKWLAYACHNSPKTAKIQLLRLEDKEIFDITEGEFADGEPVFDPKGRYLYFISYRDFNPVYGNLFFELSLTRGQLLCLVTLTEDEDDPFVEKPRALDDDGKGDSDDDEEDGDDSSDEESGKASSDEDGDKKEGDQDKEKDDDDALEIDLDGIEERVVLFPLGEGRYSQLDASEEGVLFIQSSLSGARGSDDDDNGGTLFTWNFKDRKRKRFHSNVSGYTLDAERKSIALWSDDSLRVLSLSNGAPDEEDDDDTPTRKTGWIDLDRVSVEVHPVSEWRQMLREIWRLMRDQFWREDMSGVDWDEVWERYHPLVDRLGARSEFSDLVWAMQGELGTSHAYEFGGDYPTPPSYRQGFLGIDTVWDPKHGEEGACKIARIIRGDSWSRRSGSPLAKPGIDVAEGDAILAVNGKRITREVSLEQRLVNEAGREVELLVLASGEEKPHTITVRTMGSEKSLRYREWVRERRAMVHEWSEGRIGYVHIPDMGPDGYAEFHRGFATEGAREALVVDVRFNGGGHVSPLILEKLMRRPIGFDFSRHGAAMPYPYDGVRGPVVALTNEYAGSDGDIFSHAFKMFGVGPLLGKRTWGGVIGIWPRHELVDGAVTTQPEFSFWFADVGFAVENYGTEPDIVVENPPDADAEDDDVQLEAAVKKALELLEGTPVGPPEDVGPYPKLTPPQTLPE